MYPRILTIPKQKSFFLFGPRGTGKSTWIRTELKPDFTIDLLDSETYQMLLPSPQRLIQMITSPKPKLIVIDEVQRVPELLNEAHKLIEERKWVFALTGSSARKLKRGQANLLAGRALTKHCYPLTARELGADFKLSESIKWGHLPAIFSEHDKSKFLKSYINTYLREEVQQEGLTRNIAAFSRFLEAASFSQGSVINVSSIARDVGIDRKVIEDYFSILDDLLIGFRLPVFQKKAKRRMVKHPKFYFFDVGVYRAIRPSGPLDDNSSVTGVSLETLVLQEIRALNEYLDWDFEISYWHTQAHDEVDFVLYGDRGLFAIEVKLANKIRSEDLRGLRLFASDFPQAKCMALYTGTQKLKVDGIDIVPVESFLKVMPEFIG